MVKRPACSLPDNYNLHGQLMCLSLLEFRCTEQVKLQGKKTLCTDFYQTGYL